jgi:uncharacterized membrane protein YwaF
MKGQFTIVALVITFITLVTYAVMYPILNNFIETTAQNMSDKPETQTLLRLMPFFILVAILLTMMFLVIPVRE